MKHEAEQQLLKTLNGQLNQLPSLAKEMVHQYQISAILWSVFLGIISIALLIAIIWTIRFLYKDYLNDPYGDFDDYIIPVMLVLMVGGVTDFIMQIMTIENIIHAVAPMYSIVASLIGD